MTTSFEVGAASDVGRVRTVNQDRSLATSHLAAVADGMGGHKAGEVAAAVAVETLGEATGVGTVDGLVGVVEAANRAVFDRASKDADLQGMGTTLCAIAILESSDVPELVVVNVGDSRVYLLRDGAIVQLTEDHSLVASLVRQGQLSVEEAAGHPHRNILTRALGVEPDVEVDAWRQPCVDGDRFLLCSDGLFNEVADADIAEVLATVTDARAAAEELVERANEGGGRDNITCVVVDVVTDAVAGGPAGTAQRVDAASGSASVVESPAGTESTVDPDGPDADPGRGRLFSWRVLGFVAALAVLGGVAATAVSVYRDNSYFVDVDDGDQIVIYQGRRDGRLWFAPEIVETTTVPSLSDAQSEQLRTSNPSASLDGARATIDRIVTLSKPTTAVPLTTTTVVGSSSVVSSSTVATGPEPADGPPITGGP